jgi:hypothetical protein
MKKGLQHETFERGVAVMAYQYLLLLKSSTAFVPAARFPRVQNVGGQCYNLYSRHSRGRQQCKFQRVLILNKPHMNQKVCHTSPRLLQTLHLSKPNFVYAECGTDN